MVAALQAAGEPLSHLNELAQSIDCSKFAAQLGTKTANTTSAAHLAAMTWGSRKVWPVGIVDKPQVGPRRVSWCGVVGQHRAV